MYYLLMWDTDLAANGQDGCLAKLPIPTDLAKRLIQLDARTFPKLSTLSFDDYDFFSGEGIDAVAKELANVAVSDPMHAKWIKESIALLSEARSLGKSILFDPFRLL